MVPVDDLIAHDERADQCVCGPYIRFGTGGWVVVHHALDGRHTDDPRWPVSKVDEVARAEFGD